MPTEGLLIDSALPMEEEVVGSSSFSVQINYLDANELPGYK